MKTNIKEVNERINNLNNEVAMLREFLNRAIEIADLSLNDANYASYSKECELIDRLADLKAELARLAPAPEEPVTEKDIKVSVKKPILASADLNQLKDQPHFHHESYCRKCREVATNNV